MSLKINNLIRKEIDLAYVIMCFAFFISLLLLALYRVSEGKSNIEAFASRIIEEYAVDTEINENLIGFQKKIDQVLIAANGAQLKIKSLELFLNQKKIVQYGYSQQSYLDLKSNFIVKLQSGNVYNFVIVLNLVDLLKYEFIYFLVIVFCFIIFYFIFKKRMKIRVNYLKKNLDDLVNYLDLLNVNDIESCKPFDDRSNIFEIEKMKISINNFITKILIDKKRISILEKHQIYAEVAAQFAHDIRSPLSVLNLVLARELSISDEHRELLTAVVDRINGISSSLSVKNKEIVFDRSTGNDHIHMKSIFLKKINLVSFLKLIVQEKKQFLGVDNRVSISFQTEVDAFEVFADFDETELGRILSNVINNAIESILTTGFVSVKLKTDEKLAFISILDNGIGISPELLKQLGTRQISSGKNKEKSDSGSGIGLLHAFESVKRMFGEINIKSTPNEGTEIIICLPLS